MSKEIVRPIYDTRERIIDLNIYPYTTGRVFFDTENQVIYTDIDGQRSARTDLSSIQVLDGNIQEFYERGAKGFENQIMVGKTATGFRLYYVDNEAQVHNLTFTAESVGSLTEKGVTETATFYYAGNWTIGKTYTSDAFRIAVVKQGSLFYYAKETHVAGATFDSSKWIKFSAQFESVATGLLLAENAIIARTLTMGTETVAGQTFQGTIKSNSANSLNDGSGFYFGNESNGVFRVGNPAGNFIRWDGTALTINGSIAVGNVSGLGSLATQSSVDFATQVSGAQKPANNADRTITTINNGLVTTGRLEVGPGNYSEANAGISGSGTASDSIRFWAGSNFANSSTASFRVTQAGDLTATSGAIGGYTITGNDLRDNNDFIRMDTLSISVGPGSTSAPSSDPGGITPIPGLSGLFPPVANQGRSIVYNSSFSSLGTGPIPANDKSETNYSPHGIFHNSAGTGYINNPNLNISTSGIGNLVLNWNSQRNLILNSVGNASNDFEFLTINSNKEVKKTSVTTNIVETSSNISNANLSRNNTLFVVNSTFARSVTITDTGPIGTTYTIYRRNTGSVTVAGSGITLVPGNRAINGVNRAISAIKIATGTWILIGAFD